MSQFQGSLGPFLDFQRERNTRPAERLKNGSAAASGSVVSEIRASGPQTESEYAERIAGARRLGLVVSLVIVGAVWLIKALSS